MAYVQTMEYSVIVKVMGKKIPHQTLKNKLLQMWQIPDNFSLIDLRSDYFIAKLPQRNI